MARDKMIDDAHFRIDEHQRKLDAIEKNIAPEVMGAHVQGAATMILAQVRAEHDKRDAEAAKSQAEDAEADKEVAQTNREVVARLDMLIEAIHALVRGMGVSCERVSTIDLPSGRVTVTTKETKH